MFITSSSSSLLGNASVSGNGSQHNDEMAHSSGSNNGNDIARDNNIPDTCHNDAELLFPSSSSSSSNSSNGHSRNGSNSSASNAQLTNVNIQIKHNNNNNNNNNINTNNYNNNNNNNGASSSSCSSGIYENNNNNNNNNENMNNNNNNNNNYDNDNNVGGIMNIKRNLNLNLSLNNNGKKFIGGIWRTATSSMTSASDHQNVVSNLKACSLTNTSSASSTSTESSVSPTNHKMATNSRSIVAKINNGGASSRALNLLRSVYGGGNNNIGNETQPTIITKHSIVKMNGEEDCMDEDMPVNIHGFHNIYCSPIFSNSFGSHSNEKKSIEY